MKRRDLIRHLEKHGCVFVREGSNHTVYASLVTKQSAAIPRHREINERIAVQVCQSLDVPRP